MYLLIIYDMATETGAREVDHDDRIRRDIEPG
jgi:hypothetical protein